MSDAFVRIAADHQGFLALLEASDLLVSDLDEGDGEYWVYRANDRDQSFGGLVAYGPHGLVRSIVATRPGEGAGRRILNHLFDRAGARGLRQVWLLTTDADGFFAKHGFVRVAREEAPDVIAATAQFASLCPTTAILMMRELASHG